jgi:transglutaminase-like putative cysteine protease
VSDPDTAPSRNVSSRLVLEVEDTSDVILQVAVAEESLLASERLSITSGDRELPVEQVLINGAGRAHRFHAPQGQVVVSYEAVLDGEAPPPKVTAADRIVYLRPSRYAESDRLQATAAAEFGGTSDPVELLATVASWVRRRLHYVPGASRPTDGAVQTLLAREGVCRDFAHVVIAMLRARDVPARLVAVYAPGLYPMDFHAVVEAAIGDTWYAIDGTGLAPRSSLIRISSGRDAADAAFLSNYSGAVQLVESWVTAFIEGYLPLDDHTELMSLR